MEKRSVKRISLRMYAAKERETLVIETAHFPRLGCFYVHGILKNYRGQAGKDTVFAAIVCKKCSAEQLHADGLTKGKGADILPWSAEVAAATAYPLRRSPRRAHGTLQPVWMKV